MAMMHLLHGFTGAGKTTYAKQLEKNYNALHLNLAGWVARLYGAKPSAIKFPEYDMTIRAIQWDIALRMIELGKDVILDYGFWTHAERNQIRAELQKRGISYRFYALQVPREEMRDRCLSRAQSMTEGELQIDSETFDTLWSRFEPMTEEEVCERVRV